MKPWMSCGVLGNEMRGSSILWSFKILSEDVVRGDSGLTTQCDLITFNHKHNWQTLFLFDTGNITLEELEHKHLEALEWMCLRLDNGQRQDFELLASKYQRITLDERQSLQNEFKSNGGSPSKALVKHLQVLYPSLTVRDLVRSLTEIGRNDIVQGLQQRINENESSTSV